jgi:cytoskeletal protein CcmA (bactofilin family)
MQAMNMLARNGKASFHALTDGTSEPSRTTSRAQDRRAAASVPVGPSLIGAGLSVVGRLEGAGEIQIEGRVEGDVRGHGVRIGNGAVIKGSVAAEIAHVAGTIEGSIESETVVLANSARVSGDICYRSLQIEEGAYFDGNSRPLGRERVAGENSLPSKVQALGGPVSDLLDRG